MSKAILSPDLVRVKDPNGLRDKWVPKEERSVRNERVDEEPVEPTTAVKDCGFPPAPF